MSVFVSGGETGIGTLRGTETYTLTHTHNHSLCLCLSLFPTVLLSLSNTLAHRVLPATGIPRVPLQLSWREQLWIKTVGLGETRKTHGGDVLLGDGQRVGKTGVRIQQQLPAAIPCNTMGTSLDSKNPIALDQQPSSCCWIHYVPLI